MKNKIIIAILACLVFASCGEDRRLEYLDKIQLDHWIEDTMVEYYYWYDEMTVPKEINYFLDPTSFLKSIRSTKDLDYSYVEEPGSSDYQNSLLSYGIEFDTYKYNDTDYAARVLYVKSDSPAESVGITRGDWIIKRNNEYIVKDLIDSLYRGGSIRLTLGEYMQEEDENGDIIETFKDKGSPIQLSAARVTRDNPVHFAATLTTTSGKRVGYLVYNHFTQGTNDGDLTYDNLLRTYSNEFKSAGITDFILDLRYNTGGSIESAQLLASILAPSSALGQTFCKLVYSDKHSSQNEDILFSNTVLSGGSNLDLSTLYIITGENTAATSDVLINCLEPYMNVVLFGKSTKGNYTGTHPYINEYDPEKIHILHLVDCMIHNSENAVPTSGHNPDYVLQNMPTPEIVEPFGSANEVYLAATLSLIESGEAEIPEEPEEETRSVRIKKDPGLSTLNNVQIRGTSIRK